MSINNTILKAKIESSKSNEKIEGSIIKELAQSKKLLGEVKRSGNIELYNKMLKEHNELKETILKALEGDKKFSLKERKKIMLEFTNTIYLSKGKGAISNTNKAIAYLSYGFNSATSIFSGEEKLDGYSTKEITELNKTELNLLQNQLINEYFGEEINYDNEYIKGFNNNKGNYLEKITDFEKEIQNKSLEKIDSITLASYLEYLNSKGNLDINTLKKYFGEEKLQELGTIWKNHKGETITQKLLKEAGIEKIIENIISFSDIIEDPVKTIPKLKKLPTKNDIKKVPLKKIITFNRQYKGACPVFDNDGLNSYQKFTQILSLSKTVEIEEYGKENFLNEFNTIIDKKIKDKKLSKEQIKQLKEKAKTKSEIIFNQGLDILKNPDKACGFELAIFIQNETNKFLKENNLGELTQKGRQALSLVVAKTNLKRKEQTITESEERISVLKLKKNKTKEEQLELQQLFKKQKELKQGLLKAKQIIETSQATDEEIENFINMIQNGASREDAYKNFKNNKEKNIDFDNGFYETKTIKYTNGDELTYIETPDGYNIDNGHGENEGIDITKKEFESIKDNPENLKNLLKFKETLSDLNLDFIWEKRFNFIKKLNNTNPSLNIKIDKKNYINNTELKKILNTIIGLAGEEKSNLNDLDTIKTKLRQITHSGIDKNKKDNIGSPIEKIFINKGIIDKNNSINYFNLTKMKENYK